MLGKREYYCEWSKPDTEGQCLMSFFLCVNEVKTDKWITTKTPPSKCTMLTAGSWGKWLGLNGSEWKAEEHGAHQLWGIW